MLNRIVLLLALLLLMSMGIAGYQWARATAAKDIYRDRLGQLQGEFTDLAQQYNSAVTPKPVTELLVENGIVSIIIRDSAGQVQTIPTEANGQREVYVDYALIDGRLLIRRVFDEETAPKYATTVDPALLQVDWNAPGAMYGKAIYRRLEDGRWIVSVTGDGSLGLERLEGDATIDLVNQPEVKAYDPVNIQADADAEAISPGDVWHHLFE